MSLKKYCPGFEPTIPFTSASLRRLYPQSRITWFVPDQPEQNSRYGLIIFLHGGDQESPADTPWQAYFSPHGSLRQWAEQNPYIIAAPSALPASDGKRWNRPQAKTYILNVLEEACRRYPIDRNRVILAGYSMGGFGTYHLSQLLADRLAGVLLGAGGWWESDFRNLHNLPVFILHGRRDSAPEFKGALPEARHHDWCGFSFAEAAAKIMQRDHIKYHFYIHNQGHHWSPEVQEGWRQFTEWMYSLCRNPDPDEIYVSTPTGSCDPLQDDHPQSFWLEIIQALTGDIAYDRIQLYGPNIAENEQDFQQQGWKLKRVYRSGCSAYAVRMKSGRYRIKTKNVAVFRIWLKGKDLPETIHAVWNGEVRTATVKMFRKKLDPCMIYSGYAEFR